MATFGVELFRHNLWANRQLLDACGALSQEQLTATGEGTYGQIDKTLLHLFAAEQRYVREFTKEEPPAVIAEGQPFPGLDALRRCAEASGQALIDLAERTPADEVLRGMYRGQPYEMRANLLFIQAVNHATEHRAHIVSTLTPMGIEPPRIDSLAFFQTGAAG